MPTSQVVQTSQIPTAFETYYTSGAEGQKGLIPQAFQLYGQGTPAAFQSKYVDPLKAAGLYGAGRIAPLTGAQEQVGRELTAMGTPSQFAAGTEAARSGIAGLTGALGQQPLGVTAPSLSQYQITSPERVTVGPVTTGSFVAPGVVEQYMSPYTQNVVNVQQREAIRAAQQGQLGANLAAARQGTYGGARQLLAQTERERNLGQQLAQIQATGSQAAYDAAQRAFEAEQGRGLQAQQLTGQFGLTAQQANQQAAQQAAIQNLQALMQTQQLGAGQSLEAQRANQAAQLQAAQQRQQAALGLGTLGQQMGQLGVAQQAADIDRLKTLGAYGDLQRALAQQQMDVRYQDLMRGIEFPESQLEKLSGFIRGIPTTDVTQTTTTPPPSFASQLAGLGLSGLSLYNLLGGQQRG